MKRENYKLNTWYPLTDDEYWVEEYPEEFPNCLTIVYDSKKLWGCDDVKTYRTCSCGWGTMAKEGTYFFMIIEKPEIIYPYFFIK
jgi:hypothetical protein